MTDDIRTLRDLAQRASDLNGGKRGRALGREAERHGLTLSYTTTDKILNGKYNSTPRRETLEALAALAQVPKRVAYRAAGVPMPAAPLAEQLPPDVDILDSEQRRVLIDLARVFVKQNQHIHELESRDDQDDHTKHSPPTPDLAEQDQPDAPESTDQGSESTGDRAPMSAPTGDELAELRRIQEEADAIPDEEIATWAAHDGSYQPESD